MPERRRFTKAYLNGLAADPPARIRYVYDNAVRGLGARITPGGVITLIYYRKIHGRPERITLGRFPDLAIERARAKASALNAEVAEGENPAVSARSIRRGFTFGELFALYMTRHAKVHKRTWTEDEKHYRTILAPRWASRKLEQIKRGEVQDLHAALGRERGPYTANRVLALVSTVFNRAREWGWTGDNPAKGVRRFKEHKRRRFLGGEEMPAFFRALAEEPERTGRDAIMMLILTGARRFNVMAMRWRDVNLASGVWTIPAAASKNDEEMSIPLVPAAVALLTERRELTAGGEFVFPSWSATGHITELKGVWGRVIARAGIENLRLHDLRRTLGSWQAAAGASLAVIGASLGHQSLQATQVYARLNLDPVRASVLAATDAILLAAGREVKDVA